MRDVIGVDEVFEGLLSTDGRWRGVGEKGWGDGRDHTKGEKKNKKKIVKKSYYRKFNKKNRKYHMVLK